MTEKLTPHPQAELLMAIARGEKFQAKSNASDEYWFDIPNDCCLSKLHYGYVLRIKPKTRMIGDVECAEPMREAPAIGSEYWAVQVGCGPLSGRYRWEGDGVGQLNLERGLCYRTLGEAETVANALLKLSKA